MMPQQWDLIVKTYIANDDSLTTISTGRGLHQPSGIPSNNPISHAAMCVFGQTPLLQTAAEIWECLNNAGAA